jgi:LacI family transcriptional regulator
LEEDPMTRPPKIRGKPATIKDVAKEAQVSVATVSYVVNGTAPIGQEVKARVRAAVAKLGYRANAAAKATRTGRSTTIGLILPDLRNPFFPALAQAIEQAARADGYAVLLGDTLNLPVIEVEIATSMRAYGVDGIIWCPIGADDSLAFISEEIPVVSVDRELPNYDCVASDGFRGGELLAQHLLSRGHTRFGLVTGPSNLSSAVSRRNGFVNFLPDSDMVIWEAQASFDLEVDPAILRLIAKRQVSAVVAANDSIAVGIILALRDWGISVPGDVSLVGFDDINLSEIVFPRLTTIHQPLAQLGVEAWRKLHNRILEGRIGAPFEHVHMDVSITERESVNYV